MRSLPVPPSSAVRPVPVWRWMAIVGGILVLSGIWFGMGLVSAKSNSPAPKGWVFEDDQPSLSLEPLPDSPENYLQRIQSLVAQHDHDAALKVASGLTQRFPNFQLGQWLHGELLNITGPSPTVWKESEQGERLRTRPDLLKELEQRVSAWRQPHVDGTVPQGLGFVDAATPYVAVVDAERSRFYLFANESTPNALQLRLVFDSYVTVGLNGLNKKVEGDKRSPVGVYFTQQLLPGKRLPDLYGKGALTLDYPNAWDTAQGRTGSGIWIHGTPSAQYSRAPEASDGCIVVPNDAMARLLALGQTRGIPLLIQEKVQWVPAQQAQASGQALLTALARSSNAQAIAVSWPSPDRGMSAQKMLHFFTWVDEGRRIAMTEVQRGKKEVVRQFWIEQADKTWSRFNPWAGDSQSL